VLEVITPPAGFVVVAGGWPGSLILLLALDLPIQEAYFPRQYHEYFKLSKYKVTRWHTTVAFASSGHDAVPVYLISGGVDFLCQKLRSLSVLTRVIVTVDVVRHASSCQELGRAMKEGHDLLSEFGLLPLKVADASAGGATDVQHLLGFGSNFCTSGIPSVERCLQHTIRHVLDGGIEGRFPTVQKASIPPLVNPARAILWHNEIL
jgi:hypothetical protein